MSKDTPWMAQQLRVSIFPQLEGFDSTKDLWPKFEGVEQEKQTIDSKKSTTTYDGSFKAFRVILTINPAKIDLILSVKAPARIEGGKPMVDYLGTLSEGLKEFQPIVDAWLSDSNFPPIIRLAFGAQLVKELSSREEVYNHLSQFVPFELDPKRMSDFNLQLNLLTKSKQVTDLELNRISKWGSVKMTPELIMVGNPKISHEYPTINLCHLELDINTSQDNKDPFDKKTLPSLYAELVTLGGEISEKGVVSNAN